MAVQARRHLFTATDFDRMVENGILRERDRVELRAGEVVPMTLIGPRHAFAATELRRLLDRLLGDRVVVREDKPVVVGEHWEPQPDLALLRPRDDGHREAHPRAGDVLVLVEIADSSLKEDLDEGVPAHATAGVPEVWVVDLQHRAVHVFREPAPEGGYRVRRTLTAADRLTSPALRQLDILIGAFLP